VIVKAPQEKRFRPRAGRIASTVIEAHARQIGVTGPVLSVLKTARLQVVSRKPTPGLESGNLFITSCERDHLAEQRRVIISPLICLWG